MLRPPPAGGVLAMTGGITMPELPEVETITRDLDKKIKNKTIKSVQVKVAKLVKLPNTKFVQALKGQKIHRVSRRAKLIKIELSGKKVLLIHLKLTGQLVYREKNGRRPRAKPLSKVERVKSRGQLIYREKNGKLTAGGHPAPHGLENLPNKFTHIIFTFKDSSHLFYNDLRKFGWMNLISKSEADKFLEQEFGIEPLSPEFTFHKFKELLKKKQSQPLKKALLDQKNITGIGNIYADESCFYARVKPTRKVKTLTEQEHKKLWQGIKRILKSAIKHRGTSSDTYVDASGKKGSHVPYLKVYGRTGEKCKRAGCKGVIKKIKFNGRGTHYCSRCQK